MVARTAYAEVPPRVEYVLAPLGASLNDVVASLIDWAAATTTRSAGTGSTPAQPAHSDGHRGRRGAGPDPLTKSLTASGDTRQPSARRCTYLPAVRVRRRRSDRGRAAVPPGEQLLGTTGRSAHGPGSQRSPVADGRLPRRLCPALHRPSCPDRWPQRGWHAWSGGRPWPPLGRVRPARPAQAWNTFAAFISEAGYLVAVTMLIGYFLAYPARSHRLPLFIEAAVQRPGPAGLVPSPRSAEPEHLGEVELVGACGAGPRFCCR
ncbi:winged helix-turn-helix transcriptional regulator [Streptomyces sp. NPDC058620]|uniref:winged helix-turn-helix transcriptional regulator n=1 Tax=Streptomyces sp. NPDC058620 TaxID=3346560 RepID=UPI0036535C9A